MAAVLSDDDECWEGAVGELYGRLRPKGKLSLIRESRINTLVFRNTSDDDNVDEDDDDDGDDWWFFIGFLLFYVHKETIEMFSNQHFP